MSQKPLTDLAAARIALRVKAYGRSLEGVRALRLLLCDVADPRLLPLLRGLARIETELVLRRYEGQQVLRGLYPRETW
jgi:hypothetical protein